MPATAATRVTRASLLLTALLALALAGCGGDDGPTACNCGNPDPLPPGTPANDTPEHLMTRFEAAYENQVLEGFAPLLTADFRFHFSNQTDPALVSQYGDNWRKDDELTSTENLFEGFTNENGDHVPGATSLQLTLSSMGIVGDPDHADSTTHYKLATVANASLQLQVPGTDGWLITAPHDFYLVRGDAAVLGEGQAADSTRWYVRKWDDMSPSLAARKGGAWIPSLAMPAEEATWGSIKYLYRL